MITAQDIREKTFEKATFGGYDMGEVDDFLEELAADLAAAQKETGVLKSKMKVLVDKIEEYRASEDAMHLALVSAQKVAKEIETDAQSKADALVAEAQERADAILAEAQEKADAVTGDLEARRQEEEQRLSAAKDAAGGYIEKMLLLCQQQSSFFSSLKNADMSSNSVITPAPAERPAIGERVIDVEEDAPESEEEKPDYVKAFEEAVQEDAPEQIRLSAIPGEDEEIDEPTRMFRF